MKRKSSVQNLHTYIYIYIYIYIYKIYKNKDKQNNKQITKQEIGKHIQKSKQAKHNK